MCGIFGYCDTEANKSLEEVCKILVDGIEKIEYRGYDSAGACVFDGPNQMVFQKTVGKVQELRNRLLTLNGDNGNCHGRFMGIAHTRWATHGKSTERNAHPVRSDPNGTFFVVHNGIISNYKKKKEFLISQGYSFETDTDSEVAAKLCLYHYKKDNSLSFSDLIKRVTSDCEGQYAFLFLSAKFPGQMVATQNGAPMIIGVVNPNETGLQSIETGYRMDVGVKTNFVVSSDIVAIINHTPSAIYINNGDIAFIDKSGIEIHTKADIKLTKLDILATAVDKGAFEHYMIKEIYEQAEILFNTTRNRVDFNTEEITLDTLEPTLQALLSAKRFLFVACGTSYHSSLATRKVFELLADRQVLVENASNFLDMEPHIDENDVVFFISQSGETADSISAMNYCKLRNATLVGITNTQNSTISRLAASNMDVRAGVEKGVASTKAYTSQFLSIVLIALYISQARGSHKEKRSQIIKEIQELPEKTRQCLNVELDHIVEELSSRNSILVIGRGHQASTCFEGSLKIKEISYIHSEGIMAGELKHGPLALVTSDIGIIMAIADDEFCDKSQNAFEQICARNGNPIVICPDSIKNRYKKHIVVPKTIDCLQGILSVIPLQLISYKLAVKKGHNPDFPRNLAKSVTVE
ncbi:glutamine--fructose-6-phosphate transaminase (isomerizing) [Glugoides intestinalis]